VTGGTRVLSDQLLIRITADPGEGFLDHMISLVEGATRQKTPNEIALTICSRRSPSFSSWSLSRSTLWRLRRRRISITALIALLVC